MHSALATSRAALVCITRIHELLRTVQPGGTRRVSGQTLAAELEVSAATGEARSRDDARPVRRSAGVERRLAHLPITPSPLSYARCSGSSVYVTSAVSPPQDTQLAFVAYWMWPIVRL